MKTVADEIMFRANNPDMDWNRLGPVLLLILKDHLDICQRIIDKDRVEYLSSDQMERFFQTGTILVNAKKEPPLPF